MSYTLTNLYQENFTTYKWYKIPVFKYQEKISLYYCRPISSAALDNCLADCKIVKFDS